MSAPNLIDIWAPRLLAITRWELYNEEMKFAQKRFFYPHNPADRVELEGPEHHHLTHVLRAKVGERVMLFTGDEFDYNYEIDAIMRDKTVLRYLDLTKNRANPTANLTVFQGSIKHDNLSLIVEKLNEIGATNLVIFTTDHSNTPAKSINVDKLQAIANQSCKQCGRSIPLRIHPVIRFDQMLSALTNFDQVYYADRGEKRTKLSSNPASEMGEASKTALVIGPEGGFSIEENLALIERSTSITLGSRTLRSETACLVAAALVLNKLGEI